MCVQAAPHGVHPSHGGVDSCVRIGKISFATKTGVYAIGRSQTHMKIIAHNHNFGMILGS